jgi:hypothetical protein
MQQEFGHDGGANIGKGSGSGSDEAGVAPGERGKQAEEAEDEAAQSKKKKLFANDVADHAEKPLFHADEVEIADALHGGGEHHVAGAGGEHKHPDGCPELKRVHAAPWCERLLSPWRALNLFRALCLCRAECLWQAVQ